MSFPFYKQHDIMDCGPTCLRMIAKYYGKEIDVVKLGENSGIGKDGVSIFGISEAAEKIGFKTLAAKISLAQLDKDEILLPCILFWQQKHFVVLPPQDYNSKKNDKILIYDPVVGGIKVDQETFLKSWVVEDGEGIALLLEPTPFFYE